MTSELFMENYRLDVSSDISSLITFELDNIRKFCDRSTNWSKTIVLPGTANNNKLFGHIFQIGQSNQYDSDLPNVNYNFNASKSADCLIFQDQLQTFKGVLRLLQINTIKGRIEYEVAVFGELALLNVELLSNKLEDLDFSAYDHAWTTANIIASWNNTPGSGYYYPLIDYGMVSVDKHSYDIRTFRPALYAKEYIDKMFEAAGFRYESDLFDTDRFKRLIIPYNRKTLQVLSTKMAEGVDVTSSREVLSDAGADQDIVEQTLSASGTDFTYLAGVWTYTGSTSKIFRVHVQISGDYYSTIETQRFEIRKNGVAVYFDFPFLIPTFGTTNVNYSKSFDYELTLAPGDTVDLYAKIVNDTGSYRLRTNFVLFQIHNSVPIPVDATIGGNLTVNDLIPRNVRQIDFLSAIVKLFNLYVYEDRFDSRLLYIKPYVDFYSTAPTDAIDWSYKLNRDKAVKVKPMSELTAKIYKFRYKPDNDFYNELYRKRFNEGYGDYVFDSEFEFADQLNETELLFSATPLVGYTGEEKVVGVIYKKTNEIEEKQDSNIRIMLSKKITGVASWDILDGPDNPIASTTDYGYAGHFDDPDAPSNDLNFGALRELFFILASGDLTNTQFNLYWSSYMAEITDKDSKLMSGWFYLTPKDINLLDMSKKINVDGNLFRINSIKDYNASNVSDCEVELLKVNYLIY